ncbi:MAG: glycosyltransferase family 1 protein [Gammaproteobacteria bacterium]
MAVNSPIDRARVQFSRRYRQLRDTWKAEGPGGISHRARTAVARWIQPKDVVLPIRSADIIAADLSRPFQAVLPKTSPGQPVFVNWVMPPAGPGAGGHTTLYRIVRYLEAHGYVNRLYFYDVHHGDHQYYESIVRRSYGFNGPVASLTEGMEDAHAVVATSWPTAYAVFNARRAGKRFYFVQDFEPYFYAVGALTVLAENTYRMGFHGITAGRWLAEKLRAEFGMEADYFEFGCDISRYKRLPSSRRSGVVFYARPEVARRGFELGLMAIEVFVKRRPEIELHFYGNKMGKLSFAFVDHGRVAPDRLNYIYNQCYAGLSLSLTNVSLVPHEMLAAGCIPVVNDAVHNRIVLDNPFVRYAPPNPHDLAAELESLVTMADFGSLSRAAAESVRSATWDDAGAAVDAIFRRVLGA